MIIYHLTDIQIKKDKLDCHCFSFISSVFHGCCCLDLLNLATPELLPAGASEDIYTVPEYWCVGYVTYD